MMYASQRRALGLLMAIALVTLIGGCGSGAGGRESNLQATVRFIGARFEVTNEDDAPWEDVTLRVRMSGETYTYDPGLEGREEPLRIEPGETDSVRMGAFATRDGTQLGSLIGTSSDRIAERFIIECTVKGEPGYWAEKPQIVRD